MFDFVFQNTTKIYFGQDNLGDLNDEIKKYGSKVLLCYGGGSIKKIGLYDKVINLLKAAKVSVYELAGIEPNPRHTTVNRGAEVCKNEKIDVILAVGGGSTIDCAKAIAAAAYYDGDAWDLVKDMSKVGKCLPVISILTLSATGSEMDAWSVISNKETHEKYGFSGLEMLPRVSFLDPTNTFTVSAYQTAAGSVDIMSHIFDKAYFSMQPKLQMVDEVMEAILRTIVHYAPIAIREPENYEARANLMLCSTWALNGFLNNGVHQETSCHAIEHELSAYYDITHGHGLAIVTPRWLTYILSESTAPSIYRFGEKVFGIESGMNNLDGAKLAIDKLSDFFFKELGLASTLTELGIDDKNFDAMATNVCRNGYIDGFVKLYKDDVKNIFKMCL